VHLIDFMAALAYKPDPRIKYLNSVKSMVLHEAINITFEVRLPSLELVDTEIVIYLQIHGYELANISLFDGLFFARLVVCVVVGTAAAAGTAA
jgi:hypothetical protein